MTSREQIIESYIQGYNQFDVDKMVADFDEHIVFENVQDGTTNMKLNGMEEFRAQAEAATEYFSSRTQSIKSIKHSDDITEVELDHQATVAANLPNGLKKGQELSLAGKSVFEFRDNKIIRLTDIS